MSFLTILAVTAVVCGIVNIARHDKPASGEPVVVEVRAGQEYHRSLDGEWSIKETKR